MEGTCLPLNQVLHHRNFVPGLVRQGTKVGTGYISRAVDRIFRESVFKVNVINFALTSLYKEDVIMEFH